jgi:hypothetical protein
MAWEEMNPVSDPAAVGTGSAITYGSGKIWGVFPDTSSDSMCTYFEYYDPNNEQTPIWVYPGERFDLDFLGNPAITFQWRFGGEVLVVGNQDGDPDCPMLFCYELADSSWDEEDIDDFSLGAGASIAFRQAADYYGTYVAGWMYCLAGGGQEFWCYSVPGPGDVAIDGICPGETALIADQTPHFSWQGPPAGQHRLMVSTNPNFTATGLDTVVSATQCDVPNPMDNGTYYWRTGTQNFGIWAWSATHSFTLAGGWTQLASIPMAVSGGGALAYEKDFYSSEERLLALVGGGHQYYYTYSVAEDTWYEYTTPIAQNVGTAIVTHEAAGATPLNWQGPWVVFGESSDSLYYHNNSRPAWIPYGPAGEFLLPLGPGASLAYSIESGTPYLYLTVGQDGSGPRNNFYRQELPTSGGGGQAGSTRPASVPARLINGYGKVTVAYQLSAPARVNATVFDAAGRQARVLCSSQQSAGAHRLDWNLDASGGRASPGAYFILLDTGRERSKLKAVVR